MRVRVRSGRLREVAVAVQLARRALLAQLARRRALSAAERREAERLDNAQYMRVWRSALRDAEQRQRSAP